MKIKINEENYLITSTCELFPSICLLVWIKTLLHSSMSCVVLCYQVPPSSRLDPAVLLLLCLSCYSWNSCCCGLKVGHLKMMVLVCCAAYCLPTKYHCLQQQAFDPYLLPSHACPLLSAFVLNL